MENALRSRYVTGLPVSSVTVACSTTSCTCFLKTNLPCSSEPGAAVIDGLVPWAAPGCCLVGSIAGCCTDSGGDVRGGRAIGFSEPGGGTDSCCGVVL